MADRRAAPLPTFLVVGAPKAGTTTLYHLLQQHPAIALGTTKEPHFFSFGGGGAAAEKRSDSGRPAGKPAWSGKGAVRDLPSYKALFQAGAAGGGAAEAVGEASTSYLPHPEAPARIARLLPEVRLIAVLRNPVDRAYSQHMHHVRDGREPLSSFEAALEAEAERARAGWGVFWTHVQTGLYAQQLQRYYDHFERGQLQVHLFQDLVAAPEQVARRVFSFIGVDPSVEVTVPGRRNATGRPRSRLLHAILSGQASPLIERARKILPAWVRAYARRLRRQNLDKPPLAAGTRGRLQERFAPDVTRLQGLIDRDLSHWLS